MSLKNQTILIWDSLDSHPTNFNSVVLWKSFYEKSPHVFSIPALVEQKQDIFKKRYLKFVYNVGEINLNGSSIIQHLQFKTDFNIWWSSLIIEKCNYSKSPWIEDAIRMFAFEDWVANKNFSTLNLVSANTHLANCFRLYCEENQINFKWDRLNETPVHQSAIKRLYELFPKILQGMVWLLYFVIRRIHLIGVGLNRWKSTGGQITFISYLFNLEAKATKRGAYKSNFWAHLPDVLDKDAIETNWLHIYVNDDTLPSSKDAANTMRTFNKQLNSKQRHTTLASFLSWSIVGKSLRDWYKIIKINRKLKSLGHKNLSNEFYLWPYIKDDLDESFYGVTAINNLLFYNLFDRALQLLPKQNRGIYLQENQGWEFTFLQAWKKAKHGKLIGVPHTTIRYWDLRYFFDNRAYHVHNRNQLPRPDMVAVNGKACRESYSIDVYPQHELVDVEALRYLYLKTFSPKSNFLINDKRQLRILVLGDYQAENNNYQLALLEEALLSFSQNIKLILKPHPNCPIASEDFPNLEFDIKNDSLSRLLSECDIVFTSTLTSAALDAYCANIPVISALNPKFLNFSPLKNMSENIEFISREDELVQVIKKIRKNYYSTKIDPEEIFWLDPELSMWKNVLNFM